MADKLNSTLSGNQILEQMQKGEKSISKYWSLKISWKGKYPRVFCINEASIETIDSASAFKSTNKWVIGSTFVDAAPKLPSVSEFTITVKKSPSSKPETLTFSSENRRHILSDIHEQKWRASGTNTRDGIIHARKYTSTEDWVRVVIQVTNFALLVLDPDNYSVVSTYYYTQVAGIGKVVDVQNAIVLQVGSYKRLHMYSSDKMDVLLRQLDDIPQRHCGIMSIPKLEPMMISLFDSRRLGVVLTEMSSVLEYPVIKPGPTMKRRTLCITETCVLERDVGTYNAVTCHHLDDILAVVRCEEEAQRIFIQYKSTPKKITTYLTTDRDSLLASLLDSARHIGNINVVLRVNMVNLGRRIGLYEKRNHDVELSSLRTLAEATGTAAVIILGAVQTFNDNVPYCPGTFQGAQEKMVHAAVQVVLEGVDHKGNPVIALEQFHALHRLCSTVGGFQCPTVIPGFVNKIGALVVRGIKMHHVGVTHAAIEFMNILLCPQHDGYDVMQEVNNKYKILVSDTFVTHVINMLNEHALMGTGAVVAKSIIEMLTYAVCHPYSETTNEEHFNRILRQLAEKSAVALFRLLRHSCKSITRNAGRVLQVVLEEGEEENTVLMQKCALTECAILLHLDQGAFLTSDSSREQRDLARHLIGLYCKGNAAAQDLLKRIVPFALLCFLQEKEKPGELPEYEKFNSHAEMRVLPRMTKTSNKDVEPPKLRQRTVKLSITLNWPWFFYQLTQDHTRPDLIWNHQTRHELKESIELELSAFVQGCQTHAKQEGNDGTTIAWNHYEFEVMYPSLSKELRIGGQFFLRLLLEASSTSPPQIAFPKDFFNDLYHHFLLLSDNCEETFPLKLQALQGMSMLYQFFSEPLGVFNDLGAILSLLDNTAHIRVRDQLVVFLGQLLRVKPNAKILMDSLINPQAGFNSSVLIDTCALVHLYSDQSVLHNTQNAIEGSKTADVEQSPEWYYIDTEGASVGPMTYRDLQKVNEKGDLKVWAQGLNGWSAINRIQQLKAFDSAHGLLPPRDLSCSILDIFLQLCDFYPNRSHDGKNIVQPLPRIKRYLSQANILPHLVQLLLTFDSQIVNRTATLLFQILQDSSAVPRTYQTGMFFFLLMYIGSDIRPMCRLLHLTHDQQAWGDTGSVLTPLIPTALICFLRNYGPDKFAEVFLGEYDTPEVVWSAQMRRHLIGKLSVHIMEFSPRLRSNTKAVYQYCPMVPPVEYDELSTELFVHTYYLRNLCDEARFPNWHIANPVGLLRDVLQEWVAQLELQQGCSSDEGAWTTKRCQEELELAPGAVHDLAVIRKSYFRLAALHHPDKNPQGRERFEAVQKAYEVLASDFSNTKQNRHSAKVINGNIVLLLRTQSLLFKRYSESLIPYKYAGYSQLLKLLAHEVADPDAFRKEVILIEPACELCYRTVDNAPLNADELLRENGFELLRPILVRCGEMLTPSTPITDVHAKVANHVIRCVGVSASFLECRERLTTVAQLVQETVRCMTCLQSPVLVKSAILCCSAMSRSPELQDLMFKSGAMWHLMRFIFNFDATLDKSGVTVNEENHTQHMANVLAKLALHCMCRLCGYPPEDKDESTKPHQGFHKAMQQLLSPYLVRKLRMHLIDEVLELMNESSVENPYFIWSAASKADLLSYINDQSEVCRTGQEPVLEVEYTHKLQAAELKVGDIYVRVYNNMPHYKITDPPSFMQALVASLGEMVAGQGEVEECLTRTIMMVEATRHLINSNSQLYIVVLNFFEMLLQLLCKWGEANVPGSNPRHESFVKGLVQLFHMCCMNAACVEALAIANPNCVTEICHLLLKTRENNTLQVGLLGWVNTLLTHKTFVQFALDRGLYIILVQNFTESHHVQLRELSVASLLKCITDKLNGPKILLRIGKIIPLIFMETLRDNATIENFNMLFNLYESNQESPELIWNNDLRKQAQQNIEIFVTSLSRKLEEVGGYEARRVLEPWKPSEENMVGSVDQEINICGVYLRLYVKQPNWNIRRPREFLCALFEKHVEVIEDRKAFPKDMLSLVTTSILANIRAQPLHTDMIPSFGHLGRIYNHIGNPDKEVSSSCLAIAHECSLSAACVQSLMLHGSGCTDPIKPIMTVVDEGGELFGLAVETIERMMARSTCEKGCLIKLALSYDIITKFLTFLEHDNSISAAKTRAIVVKSLKAMSNSNDILHGGEVRERLNSSPVWAKFSKQNMDLFLTQNTFAGYLTGPAGQGPTLSITAGASNLSAPPSLRREGNMAGPPPINK